MGVCQSDEVQSRTAGATFAAGSHEDRVSPFFTVTDAAGKTSCPEAANEFTTRMAAKSAVRSQPHTTEALPDHGPVAGRAQSSMDFTATHCALLGRCWGLSAKEVLLDSSSANFPTDSYSDLLVSRVMPRPQAVDMMGAIPASAAGRRRSSRWVSLVHSSPISECTHSTRLGEGDIWSQECHGGTLGEEGVLMVSDNNLSASQKIHSFPSCIAGAKDVFAFCLPNEVSTLKDTSFIRKAGMHARRGTHVSRWDRIDFASSCNPSANLTVFPPQSLTHRSSSPDSSTVEHSLSRRGMGMVAASSAVFSPQDSDGSLGGLDSTQSSQITHSSQSSVEQNMVEPLGKGEAGVFSSESIQCHCLTGAEGDEEGASLNCTQHQKPLGNQNPMEPDMEVASFVGSDISNDTFFTFPHPRQRRETCVMETAPTLVHIIPECRKDTREQPSEPLLASIVVSCFDASINPSMWEVCGYKRTPINCLDITAPGESSDVFGDGVVTNVMYGGVCLVECSSEEAVRVLQSSISVAEWGTPVSDKSLKKAMKELVRRSSPIVSRKGNGVCIGGNPAGHDRSGAVSSGVSSLSNPVSYELCRIVKWIGGKQYDREYFRGGLKEQGDGMSSTSSKGSGAEPITPWMRVEVVGLLLRDWALSLFSHSEYVRPIAIYVQRFLGILPFLKLKATRTITEHTIHSSDECHRSRWQEDDSVLSRADCGHSEECRLADLTEAGGMHDDNLRTSPCVFSNDQSSNGSGWRSHVGALLTCAEELGLGDDDGSPLVPRRIERRRRAVLGLLDDAGGENVEGLNAEKIFSMTAGVARGTGGVREQALGDNVTVIGQAIPLSTEEPLGGELASDRPLLNGNRLTGSDAELSTTDTTLPLELFVRYDEAQALWEQSMLEVRALNNELKDLVNAGHAAAKELAEANRALDDVKQYFLPNSCAISLEPLCAYLTAALNETDELPERKAYIGGADWFPCLAAIMASPSNTLCGVEILHPMTISSLPQLGMVAGLLHCGTATTHLLNLTIPCDKLCSSLEELKGKAPENKQNWLRRGSSSRRKTACSQTGASDQLCSRTHNKDSYDRLVPFRTLEQVQSAFLEVVDAISANNCRSSFTLQLKGFPSCRPECFSSKVRRFFAKLFHTKDDRNDEKTRKFLAGSTTSSEPSYQASAHSNCIDDDFLIPSLGNGAPHA
uniref:Uncharacterized protein n=1 Tax=Trypanosoma congolense (strain IL3000) TaxID=1068625 RepID=G0USB2_TRYCI|nr:conserved hypothetical protein [Trypanosoma congolense IL3000]